MPFTPPLDATQSVRKPDEGFVSCGWLAFEAWRTANARTYQHVCDAISVAKGAISGWKDGRLPNEATRKNLALLASVDPESWLWWVRLEGHEALDEPAPPASEERITPPVRALGSTREELLETVRQIDATLRTNPADTARANLLGKRTSALVAVSRLEQDGALTDHPEFVQHKADIIASLREVFAAHGIDPVKGLRAWVDALTHIEANRSRRAA